LAARTAAAGTTVISTLAVFRGIPEQISDLEQVLSRAEVQYIPRSLGTLWNWWEPSNSYKGRFGRDMVPWFERQYRIMTGLALAFQREGVRMLAGTDTPTPAVVPGFSIHDELQALVKAGLSRYEALKTATVNPGAFLHASSDAGTIEEGKRADLVLLAGNPLENIRHTTQIEGVVLNGTWYSKQVLQQFIRSRRNRE
jgi:predicted amidohydrolase YtcJ